MFLNLGTGNWEPKWGNEFIYSYYPNNNFQAAENGKRKASRRRHSMPNANRTHGERWNVSQLSFFYGQRKNLTTGMRGT